MAQKRQDSKRYMRRIEAEFTVNGRTIRGISSNISAHGIFIRTHTPMTVGSTANIELIFPDGTRSSISGTVRRSTRTSFAMVKNGMGVELTSRDARFIELLAELGVYGEAETDAPPEAAPEPAMATLDAPHAPDPHTPEPPPAEPEYIIVDCQACGTKNRVRLDRVGILLPRCGRCKAELQLA